MTTARDQLIQLVYEINKELLMGEAGWRMDKCADMIETYVGERVASHLRVNQALVNGCNRMLRRGSKGTTADIEEYVAIREAALVERILDRFGDDDDICGLSIKEIIREAARRKA